MTVVCTCLLHLRSLSLLQFKLLQNSHFITSLLENIMLRSSIYLLFYLKKSHVYACVQCNLWSLSLSPCACVCVCVRARVCVCVCVRVCVHVCVCVSEWCMLFSVHQLKQLINIKRWLNWFGTTCALTSYTHLPANQNPVFRQTME